MKLPRSADLDLPEKSRVWILWFVLRYLKAHKQPVYMGTIAKLCNQKARQFGLKPEMEASWARYLRAFHINSIADYLTPVGLRIVCGRNGVGRGKVMIREVVDV